MADNTEYKFIVALNKGIPEGKVINAAAHAAAGLAHLVEQAHPEMAEAMEFLTFTDAGGRELPAISARSLIVLRGKAGELGKLATALRGTDAATVCFVEGMTGDTYVEQLERVATTPPDAHVYYAVAAFGHRDDIDPHTRRLSLWQ